MMAFHNMSKSESTFKKCNAIACHAFCKSVAVEESLTRHKRFEDNTADLLTTIITGHEQKHLMSLALYGIYDGHT